MAMALDVDARSTTETRKFDVGGVLLDRPFKIRRLGHFGFHMDKLEEGLHFYSDLLGFRTSDVLSGPDGPHGYFLRHGTDHHSLLIERPRHGPIPKHHSARPEGTGAGYDDTTINQITWQVGGLRELMNAVAWLQERDVTMRNLGRGMPGFNYHAYFFDPEGHVDELYYGIEQIGWTGESRPTNLYRHDRHFRYAPELPQIPDGQEVLEAREQGLELHGGVSTVEGSGTFDVEGVMLRRPFRIVRIGPIRLFVADFAKSESFYREILGFELTEEVTWQGHRCIFLRNNTEHHSLALYPIALREALGLRADSSCMSLGAQVATYRQLRDAVMFLRDRGCTVRELPAELFPGLDRSAFVFDPDGNGVQLYSYMEQIGWDGKPRPRDLRPAITPGEWPETVPGQADSYAGEVFLGPLG
jgi:catechol 2,3-dioxygenase-like lactoylglutathione lyase family enzyme